MRLCYVEADGLASPRFLSQWMEFVVGADDSHFASASGSLCGSFVVCCYDYVTYRLSHGSFVTPGMSAIGGGRWFSC